MKQSSKSQCVVHFAGDSGDGIQITGNQFAQNCAIFGNDVRTLPDFPAEIRAPQGTLAGVSGFKMCFASEDIFTPGDKFDILVAFNPAAYQKSHGDLKPDGLLIVDEAKFTAKECRKLGLDPTELLQRHRAIALPMTSLTVEALKDSDLSRSAARKCKNFFALGVICWITHRPLEPIKTWLKQKFSNKQDVLQANVTALRTGYDYAVTVELFSEQFKIASAEKPIGRYRQVTGNEALAMGALAASALAQKPLFMSGYPITPASDILHFLSSKQSLGVKTFQAEDEMAAAGACLGASFAGSLALTATSGPGMDLKSESIGLGVMAELPMVVVNVQRAGPSTGMPTKVEQADLLASLYGRHGECPVPVLAPASPEECFNVMISAFRVAVQYMTPVIVLSDANLANSMQAWRIPNLNNFEPIVAIHDNQAYDRNHHFARGWVLPGTPDKMHRLGGLEKDLDGHISYEPDNHESMVALRAQKIQSALSICPSYTLEGDQDGECLLIGWGSTYGALKTALAQLCQQFTTGLLQIRTLYPLDSSIQDILKRYRSIIVVELNSGQLCQLIRAKYLVDAKPITQIQGRPFEVEELIGKITQVVEQEQCMPTI